MSRDLSSLERLVESLHPDWDHPALRDFMDLFRAAVIEVMEEVTREGPFPPGPELLPEKEQARRGRPPATFTIEDIRGELDRWDFVPTQADLAAAFDVSRSTVSRHISRAGLTWDSLKEAATGGPDRCPTCGGRL